MPCSCILYICYGQADDNTQHGTLILWLEEYLKRLQYGWYTVGPLWEGNAVG
jgi:hypothetical protein